MIISHMADSGGAKRVEKVLAAEIWKYKDVNLSFD